jgi:hypothetical protein
MFKSDKRGHCTSEVFTGNAHLLDVLLNHTAEETPFNENCPRPRTGDLYVKHAIGIFISRYAVLHSVYHGG